MSKHIGRKQRWTQASPREYSSSLGKVVYQQKAWYGLLRYKTPAPEPSDVAVWVAHDERLGPFKRPRNAMVALEREVAILRNRHGQNRLLNDQPWAET
jgi:hypothetical protein